MVTRSCRIGTTVFLVLAGLASSSNARAEWVVGGTQFANNYFTEVSVTFTVPPAPTAPSNQVDIAFWPGIEDQQGQWVLQPVLHYGLLGSESWQLENQVDGPSNGNPNNTSCSIGNATYCDNPQTVSAGDNIFMAVAIDQGNPGTQCQLSTGTNCNYNIMWYDFNSGFYSVLQDWTAPTPLVWAQGLVFETGSSTASCNAYPAGLLQATVGLFENVGNTLYHQDTDNMVAGNPGNPPFTNPTNCFFEAATSGQTVEMLLE